MTPEQWAAIKHFHPVEFDSPDVPGSGAAMDFRFVSELDAIREAVGFPLVIHSGFRSQERNAALKDAKPDSAHLRGFAADIGAPLSIQRFALAQAAFARGFRRIGIGSGFVHLDLDPTLPQGVLWLYPAR